MPAILAGRTSSSLYIIIALCIAMTHPSLNSLHLSYALAGGNDEPSTSDDDDEEDDQNLQ